MHINFVHDLQPDYAVRLRSSCSRHTNTRLVTSIILTTKNQQQLLVAHGRLLKKYYSTVSRMPTHFISPPNHLAFKEEQVPIKASSPLKANVQRELHSS